MNTQPPKPPSKHPKPISLTSHFAMIELKQRILTSISKLSDKDTHQIGVQDLEAITQTISSDGVSMLLNCLCDVSGDPKPAVKKEALRLIGLLCTSHSDSTSTHLTKIIAHVVRRIKDLDSGVRDCCREVFGVLAGLYLKGEGDNSGSMASLLSLFLKPLFETMGEEKKVVQAGAALCMARMVERAEGVPVATFQKLCGRICKFLNSHNFLAKAALLSVVASLSEVGAITSQNMPTLLQSILDCLESSDWTTRKAAADTLSTLATHTNHLITERASSAITALEACRFDKVKPVRDSVAGTLQLLKKTAENVCDVVPDCSNDASCEAAESIEKPGPKRSNRGDAKSEAPKEEVTVTSTDSHSDVNSSISQDKTGMMLNKKKPNLSNKEVNPEFFQKLDTSGSDDIPLTVLAPSRIINSSTLKSEEQPDQDSTTYRCISSQDRTNRSGDGHISDSSNRDTSERGHTEAFSKQHNASDFARDRWTESRTRKDLYVKEIDIHDRVEAPQRDHFNDRTEESFSENKGSWIGIQRQLSQLERQQTHLMNMLQDFMGGSHSSMVTLENRVRGLERIVDNMQRDVAMSSGRRASNFVVGVEGSSGRPLGKYSGHYNYSNAMSGREYEGRWSLPEKFLVSDGVNSSTRGRDLTGRSEVSEKWDSFPHGASRNGYRRNLGSTQDNGRLSADFDQVSVRKAWEKGNGRVRLGEGPSARSVWHASKDEATLEAIRVAGDDNGTSRPAAQVAHPELSAEALEDDTVSGQNQGEAVWRNVIDASAGDMEMAYADVLSTRDDFLLVKLMDRSGPVIDQLSDETAIAVLHAVGEFLLEQSLSDIGLSWIQQLVDLIVENGPDFLVIPFENKRELLLSLGAASSLIDLPRDWEGGMPDQLMCQLASAWEIDLQR